MKNNILTFFQIIDRASYLGSDRDSFFSAINTYILISVYFFGFVGSLGINFYKLNENIENRNEAVVYAWLIAFLFSFVISYVTIKKRAVFFESCELEQKNVNKKIYGLLLSLVYIFSFALNSYISIYFGLTVFPVVLLQLLIYPFVFESTLKILEGVARKKSKKKGPE